MFYAMTCSNSNSITGCYNMVQINLTKDVKVLPKPNLLKHMSKKLPSTESSAFSKSIDKTIPLIDFFFAKFN